LKSKHNEVEAAEAAGEILKRLLQLFKRPVLPTGPVSHHTVLAAVAYLAASAWLLGEFVGFTSEHLLLSVDPEKFIRWRLWGSMLIVNAIGFVVVLYALAIGPLYLKHRHAHLQIVSHGLRAFALLNFPATLLCVLGANNTAVSGVPVPDSGAMWWVMGVLLLLFLFLIFRILILPIARYGCRAFSTRFAYFAGLVVTLAALTFNPVIANGYFSYVLDKENFCSAMISVRFHHEFTSDAYSRDCLVTRCVEGVGADSAAGFATECPALISRKP